MCNLAILPCRSRVLQLGRVVLKSERIGADVPEPETGSALASRRSLRLRSKLQRAGVSDYPRGSISANISTPRAVPRAASGGAPAKPDASLLVTNLDAVSRVPVLLSDFAEVGGDSLEQAGGKEEPGGSRDCCRE